MRDKKRIKIFCNEFAKIWETQFCDQRFGQLMSNFFGWVLGEKKCSDIWFPEDDKWTEWFKEFAEFSPHNKKEAGDV